MIRLILLILGFIVVSSAAFADTPYWGTVVQDGQYQRYYGRGDVGVITSQYLGTDGTAKFVTTPGGMAKYDWQPRAGGGLSGVRNVALEVAPTAENGLQRAVATTVADAITATPAALSSAARFAVYDVLPVVGAGITAWQIYQMLSDHGITYDDQKFKTLVVPISQGPNVQYSIGSFGGPDGNHPVSSCVSGTQVSGLSGAQTCVVYQIDMGPAHYQFTQFEAGNCSGRTSGSCSTYVDYTMCNSASGYCGPVSYYINLNIVGTSCPPDWTVQAGTCYYKRPATPDEFDAAVSSSDPSKQVNVIHDLQSHNYSLPLPTNSSSTFTPSPASVDTPSGSTTSTTTNPDGSTTTTTQQNTQHTTFQSQGDNLSNSSVVTNTTNNYTTTTTNNATGATTTTTVQNNPPPVPAPSSSPSSSTASSADPKPVDPCADGACAFTDGDMPTIPSLYTQKYPNGIVGVWNSKAADLQNTKFMTGIKQMFPNLGSGGSCPAWGLDMNIGPGMNYGYQTFGVSCAIWQVVGLIMLTSACFTAWRIIF